MSQVRSATWWSSLLRDCTSPSSIKKTKKTHLQILLHGFLPSATLETDLLLAYSKCGRLEYAQQVFNQMACRNMHSWNILISSYVQNSQYLVSLTIFRDFLKLGLRPDHFTFPSIFKACAATAGTSYLGLILHSCVIKLGLHAHVIVACSILDFYAKCGNIIDAQKLFEEMSVKDTVVWNSLISGFVRAGYSAEALSHFRNMCGSGSRVEIDSRTIPSILSACGKEGDLMRGKEIHGQVVKRIAFGGDAAIGNSLVDMYAKCGCLDGSQNVFDNMSCLNLITWTTLISSYGLHGKGDKSMILFEKMKGLGFIPNSITFTAVLASCSHSGLIDQGRKIVKFMNSEYGINPSVEHYACMVDLLGRSGNLEEALELIKKMPHEAPPSVWGALLGACRLHKNVVIGETAAYRLFELEAVNSSNYIALCSIYESIGKRDEISKIRSRMRELGLVKKPGCSWMTINGKARSFYQGDISHIPTKLVYESLNVMIRKPTLDYNIL